MVECRYCTQEFEDDDSLLDHLATAHEDELSAIDQRRVADRGEDTRSLPISASSVGLLIGVALFGGIIIWAITAFAGGGAPGDIEGVAVSPSDLWSVHTHGTITVEVLGDSIDFSQSQYQLQADPFHFENNNGDRWHVHAQDVTLEYAMWTLGFEINDSAFSIDGETYRDGSPAYEVIIQVNGEDVTPASYRLQEGDRVRIIVRNETEQSLHLPSSAHASA